MLSLQEQPIACEYKPVEAARTFPVDDSLLEKPPVGEAKELGDAVTGLVGEKILVASNDGTVKAVDVEKLASAIEKPSVILHG
jgi:hypothetical protein